MPRLELIHESVIFRNPNPGYRYVMAAFSHPVQLPDGTLLCSYNRGQALYATDLTFYLARSHDRGVTWDDHMIVHDPALDDKSYSYHDPFLTLLRNGTLVISAFRVDRSDPEKPIFNEATGGLIDVEMILLRSHEQLHNGCPAWSQPQVITAPPGMWLTPSTGIVELNSGAWFLPCDRWHGFDEHVPYRPATVGLFSHDEGHTWGNPVTFATVTSSNTAAGVKGFWHGKIVRLDDGRLLTLFWAADLKTGRDLMLHRCMGSADGQQWSAPEVTNLPGQTNHIVQIEDGLLAAIYTQRTGPQPGFRVALSEDWGQHWDVENQLLVWDATGRDKLGVHAPEAYPRSHDTIAFGAPTAMRLHNGELLVSFWCTEMSVTHVRCARIRVV